LLKNKNRSNLEVVGGKNLFVSVKDYVNILITFSLTLIAWVFFRAVSVVEAFSYLKQMIFGFNFGFPSVDIKPLLFIFILIVVEWLQRTKQYGLELSGVKNTPIRWVFYIVVFCLILFFGAKSQSFIYFQF